ncbi:NAD(P)H-binding protein [Enterobacter sp. Bisph1]|uniref:NAD(P)H-binding protein n=1 Tax=Enterobacter sp. Bisph1 TaxID=1274399 RepID=UPI00068BAB63|nr:NAD(P)H-binding protein [Enterobacter sp. Bisph1]
MEILVIGHGSRLGQELIRQAFDESISCRTYEDVITCDRDELKEAIRHADVIISFRGGTLDSLAQNISLISLIEDPSQKFLLVTSFGCGDSWPYISDMAKNVFGEKVKYKTLSEAWLQLSYVNWNIIRPVGLSDKHIEGKAVVTRDKTLPSGYVSRQCFVKIILDIIRFDWNQGDIVYVYTER